MSRYYQRGVAHILLMLVLLAGLAFGVYLVQQKTNLFSRASSGPISGPIYPSPTTSNFGKSLKVDNTTLSRAPQLVTVQRQTPFTIGKEFTVEFFVKLNKATTGRRNIFRVASPSQKGITISADYNGSTSVNDLVVRFSDGVKLTTYNLPVLSVGAWHHVAVTYSTGFRDDGSETHVARVFVDGDFSKQAYVFVDNYADDNLAIIEVGELLDGEIDELRVSDQVRYSTEFTNNRYPYAGPFDTDAGTLLLLHFDGNVQDYSSYKNHGQLNTGKELFVDSTLSSKGSTPSPTTAPPPDVPAPIPLPPGCFEIPIIGVVCTGDKPDPNLPTPTPTISYMGVCADSAGNGPDGIKCQTSSYYSSSDSKCSNKNLYPYYYTRCLQSSVTPSPSPTTSPTSIGGACADSVGNGYNIKCEPSSYNSNKDSTCTNKNLYPYYYDKCNALAVPPPPTGGKDESCSAGQTKECIGYSSNGVNAYCWQGSTYIKAICNSSCANYGDCK